MVLEKFLNDFSELERLGELTFSCFLVAMGIGEYNQGTYWAKIENHLKKSGGNWQHRWGELFLKTIRKYHLTDFPHAKGHKYVTPILLHGGIPDNCLQDFFSKVLYPIVSGKLDIDSHNPEEIVVEWKNKASYYATTDKPVRRFLEEGGKPAADFLSRCLEMVRAAHYETQFLSGEELGIPHRVAERFKQWWKNYLQPTLTESHIALRRPRIEFISRYGEVRCTIMEQTLASNSNAPVSLHAFADGTRLLSQELDCYRRSTSTLTEPVEFLLPPAHDYKIKIQQAPHISREWIFKGLDENAWLAFDDKDNLICASELPHACFWLILHKDVKFASNIRIIEQTEGADAWRDYQGFFIDALEAESLAILKDKQTIPLPLAKDKEAQLCGKILEGCSVNDVPIYSGQLPVLQIPIASWSDIDSWYVVVEELSHRWLSRKQVALSEALHKAADGKAILHLEHPKLLGNTTLGEFRLKLRSRGALGRDKQFQFAFIRDVDFEFTRAFYLAKQTPKLTLLTSSTIKVLSEDVSTIILGSAGSFEITNKSQARQFTLNLQSEDHRKLPITFKIPRLRWALKDFAHQLSTGWLDKPREVSFDDFAASDEAVLVIESPLKDGTIGVLELEGADHLSEQKIRRGEARFDLSRFNDSLRSLAKSLAKFRLSFVVGSNHLPAVYPLSVRTRWLVESLECRDIRTVSLQWKDAGHFNNRKLRLWDLRRVWQPPKEYRIPDGVSELTIQEDAASLPAGRYRAELFLESQYATAPPALPPRKNGKDIFDLAIGREEIDSYLLVAPFSFRRYLTSKLAGCEETFDWHTSTIADEFMRYSLTSEEMDTLFYTLLFLAQNNQAAIAKTIWFTDLHQQAKQESLRDALRERIKQFAQRGDDTTKAELRKLCQTIGVAVNALMPFAIESKVNFDNKIALYKGIRKWTASNSRNLKEEPWDLISLGYVNSQSRIVHLSFLDKMEKAPDDAPLSGY
ncbi:MAG: hypothetical protein HY231_16015 [Acidobacteria bacterium]|nr:hypothetical protein [Acidobacteriota bacterium]